MKKIIHLSWIGVLALGCLAPIKEAIAARWTKAYITALPDSAFASVETDKNGKKLRHLPHHDASGKLDAAHLRSALSRWKQVKWVNPKNAQSALDHLKRHLQELKASRKPRRQEPEKIMNRRR